MPNKEIAKVLDKWDAAEPRNGKGDKARHDIKKYKKNYSQINWGKKK